MERDYILLCSSVSCTFSLRLEYPQICWYLQENKRMIYTLKGINAKSTQKGLLQMKRASQNIARCREYPRLYTTSKTNSSQNKRMLNRLFCTAVLPRA
jgi:hypothetical protein